MTATTASIDPLGDELLALATHCARQGAELVMARADGELGVDTKSSATDLVTEVDRASEKLIVEAILAARPDDAIVGEEGTGIVGTTGVEWHIDPIDGTTNFVYGYPGFAVSIAANVDGETRAGVVADPTHGDLYTARLGAGAHRNGEPISVSDRADLASSLIETGFSYLADRRQRQAQALTQLLPAVRDIRRGGAAATALCYTACGRVDAFFEAGLGSWDVMAGMLIAREAGAVTEVRPDGDRWFAIAVAPALADALFELLETSGADQV